MLVALFKDCIEPQSEHGGCTKRHHQNQTIEVGDEAHERKRESKKLEQARSASFVDKEIRQRRELETPAGASCFVPMIAERRTTDGAKFDVVTTNCNPSDDLASSWKLNPPSC